jgi:hypothetical protein
MVRIGLEVDTIAVAGGQVARAAGARSIAADAATTLGGVVAGNAFGFAGAARFAIRADRALAAAAFRA